MSLSPKSVIALWCPRIIPAEYPRSVPSNPKWSMILPMRLTVGTLILGAGLAQTPASPADPVRTLVGRLQLAEYKAHIKGLTQFGDRMQGTQRNRDAIDWLEKELRSYGYTNVVRQRFMSASGPLENISATKVGATIPGEMYIVSAHMDGRGGGEAADDDGSGCSLVLELARVLGRPEVQTERSLRFAFWNNEEFGMDGSGTHCDPTTIFDVRLSPRTSWNVTVDIQESAAGLQMLRQFSFESQQKMRPSIVRRAINKCRQLAKR